MPRLRSSLPLCLAVVTGALVCFFLPWPIWSALVGGVVAGLIARRNGWVAGLCASVLTFVLATAILANLASFANHNVEATNRTLAAQGLKPIQPPVKFPLVPHIWLMFPLGALGGFCGGWVATMLARRT